MSNNYLFMEFPANIEEMSVDDATRLTRYKLIDNKYEAGDRAERLGLPWPVFLARRKQAAVFTVSGVKDYEMENYVLGMIRNEVEILKNPRVLSQGGCGCGVITGLLSVGSGPACGCGSSCQCGK